jgi:hypothetical protein
MKGRLKQPESDAGRVEELIGEATPNFKKKGDEPSCASFVLLRVPSWIDFRGGLRVSGKTEEQC